MMRYDGFMVCLSKNWDLTSDMEIHNCVPIKNSRKVEMGRRHFFFGLNPQGGWKNNGIVGGTAI